MNQKPSSPLPYSTLGGLFGHYLRRLIHLSCLVGLTVLFYQFSPTWATWSGLRVSSLLAVIFVLVVAVECLRLRCGWLFIAQREHERHQPSSAAMSLIGLCVVGWVAPSAAYAYMIVATAALIDPLIGELKRHAVSHVYLLALLGAWLIWIGGAVCFIGVSWWLVALVPPVTVLVEKPCWRYLDDNFLMLAVPAAMVWCWVVLF